MFRSGPRECQEGLDHFAATRPCRDLHLLLIAVPAVLVALVALSVPR
jgi:hypothetical protein